MLPTNRCLYFLAYFSCVNLDKTPMEALNSEGHLFRYFKQ